MIGYIVLIIVLIAGYSTYLAIRDRRLEKRIDTCSDPDIIMAEMDMEIQKTKEEDDFFRKQSGRGRWP